MYKKPCILCIKGVVQINVLFFYLIITLSKPHFSLTENCVMQLCHPPLTGSYYLLSLTQEMEIKKMAKTGNRDACKVLAKQLVQVRKQKTRTYAVSSKVTSMSTQTKLMNSQMKMAGAMATTTKVRSFCLFELMITLIRVCYKPQEF